MGSKHSKHSLILSNCEDLSKLLRLSVSLFLLCDEVNLPGDC